MTRTPEPLQWNEVDENWFRAIGAKGTYEIQQLTPWRWLLTCQGHDGLPLMELPGLGKSFNNVDAAQLHAAELDSLPSTGEMSLA